MSWRDAQLRQKLDATLSYQAIAQPYISALVSSLTVAAQALSQVPDSGCRGDRIEHQVVHMNIGVLKMRA
jgi:hypothetical protein